MHPRNVFSAVMVFAFVLSLPGSGTPLPYLVKDINAHTSNGSAAFGWMLSGPQPGADAFFSANDNAGQARMWRTDGTPQGTALFASLGTGMWGGGVNPHAFFDGLLYFNAWTYETGAELYRSDGSFEGTTLAYDLEPGEGSSAPESFVQAGGALFFLAGWNDAGSARNLYRMLPGAAPARLMDGVYPPLVVYGDRVVFAGGDAANGSELWSVDPSGGSVALWLDVVPGSGSSNARPRLAHNGRLYFTAEDPQSGFEPWVTTGPAGTTARLADIIPGSIGSNPSDFAPLDDRVLFLAHAGYNAYELWSTGGTPATTVPLRQGDTSTIYLRMIGALDGVMFFYTLGENYLRELWRTDGTPAGTQPVMEMPYVSSTSAMAGEMNESILWNGSLYFAGSAAGEGVELWRINAADTPPERVVEINPGPNGSYPGRFSPCGARLCFAADDGDTGFEPWSTDGSTAARLGDLVTSPPGSYPSRMTVVGKRVFFVADDGDHGPELWVSDGTSPGTNLTRDLHPGLNQPTPVMALPGQDRLLFTATGAGYGQELWVSDGTAEGTQVVLDIVPGSVGSLPNSFTAEGRWVYFMAFDGSGRSLWRTDGTSLNTQMVAQLPVPSTGWLVRAITVAGDRVVYIVTYSSQARAEIRALDLATKQAWVVKSGLSSYDLYGFTRFNNHLYFAARDWNMFAPRLWQTDGEAGDAVEIPLDATSPPFSQILNFTPEGSRLFFFTRASTGSSLWVYTPGGGAQRLTDGKQVRAWAGWAGQMAFTATDTTYPDGALWLSDGTPAGTQPVSGAFTLPQSLAPAGPLLFFSAQGEGGGELWQLKGGAASRAADIVPGPGSSDPNGLVYAPGRLFFSANHPATGMELWALTLEFHQVHLPAIHR